ncbi:hypothetical protein C7460_10469 [Marinoscillum furvescens DSM 4134]|uniref:DUF4440 domain-containing protein n=2 Tax=Marinoscillum furvescens TaxID=1026 RepID=A0A3D9L6X7_MARFU|nr:hypothetical protein C7460_10469 [Marinoscillum furvescens DSM 4134]
MEPLTSIDSTSTPSYTENALLLDSTGLSNQRTYMDTSWTRFSVAANKKYTYAIVAARKADHHYKQLLITDQANQRELELTLVASEVAWDSAIDQRRNDWIRLCNAHHAAELINNLYLPEAIYYNHKPPITDRTALIAEYAYMNRPEYSLHLAPLHREMVNTTFAFEIGQCSGSYGGKYMICWQKDAQGKWMVFMDSNI